MEGGGRVTEVGGRKRGDGGRMPIDQGSFSTVANSVSYPSSKCCEVTLYMVQWGYLRNEEQE